MQHPRKKAFINIPAKGVAVNFHLGVQIHDIGHMDKFNAVRERLKIHDAFGIFRVHQGNEQGRDVFLDILDLVDSFTDDVVQFHEPFGVIRLHIHQRINAVIGLGVAGVQIPDGRSIPQQGVEPVLEMFVTQNIYPQCFVTRIEYGDPLPQAAIEAVWPGVNHAIHIQGGGKPLDERVEQ